MRAIISVSDKSGVTDFARGLAGLGVELFSTGGTKKSLAEAGVAVHSISDITGFPEILDGRVKTLHPMVHGGLLARRDLKAHMDELAKYKITPIDLVVVNLYPFVQTVSKAGVTIQEALENIDIGGPHHDTRLGQEFSKRYRSCRPGRLRYDSGQAEVGEPGYGGTQAPGAEGFPACRHL